ncbi:MAG: Chromosome segregation ATPase-like protein [Candidatus Saccharibacteria bacterium]|nr:Chromosome segregation ATPase-like protein [Candidatus Saccharibacteria bacterium]
MLRRILLSTAALVMLVGAVLGFAASSVGAASSCDATVVDNAHVFGDGLSHVQTAADKLKTVGADVRVRTITSLGSFGSLDDYVHAQEANCASWSPGGTLKNNLLVFAMALNDHKVGIFFGDKWTRAFDSNGGELRIQSDFMAPRFKNGEFAGGFADGMNESGRVLNDALHPQSGGNGSTTVVNKKPTNLTGLWLVLGSIVALLAIGGLVYFLYTLVRRRHENQAACQVAQQEAIRARDAAGNVLDELRGRDAVRTSLVNECSAIGGDEAVQLQAALQAYNQAFAAATTIKAQAAEGTAAKNVSDNGLPLAIYEAMGKRYQDAEAQAETAKRAAQTIDELAGSIKAEHDRMSQDLQTTQAALEGLNTALQSLKDEGIHVDTIGAHATATKLADAKEHEANLASLRTLGEARDELKQGQAALDALTQQREQLTQGIPALQARTIQVTATVSPAKEAFDRISKAYAPSCWESVQGNGTEAQKRIDAAVAMVTTVTQQSSVEQQQWDDALASLQQGNLLLDQAQGLLRSITELEGNLQTAKEQAPQEIDAAAADIAKAEQYIRQYDGDIDDGLEDNLKQAQQLLDQAKAELAKELPDYLQVVKLATGANSSADDIYAKAASEHEAAERLRRQAASTLAQAPAAISKAEEYIDDHRSDVESGADSYLSSAKQSLNQAQGLRDPADVLRSATAAIDQANQAYESAKRDFQEAEAARRRARQERERQEEEEREERERRNDNFGLGVGVGYGLGSSSGSSFGNWGSSGGGSGGGSSIDFGGGGGGGGSSSSW